MVSSTDVGGNKPNSKDYWNKNKPKPGTQVSKFTGTATSESVLHNKVITSCTNQDGQLITLVEVILSFIGINHYVNWAESFQSMERKIEADFIPIAPHTKITGLLMLLVYSNGGRMLLTRKKTTTEIINHGIKI